MASHTRGVMLVSLLVFVAILTPSQGVNNTSSTHPVAPQVVPVDGVVLRENGAALMQCSGADVIAWYHGRSGRMLTNELLDDKGNQGKYVITETGLNVTRVGRADVGVYVCFDRLTGTNYTVQLFMKPTLGRRFPPSLNMAEGDSLKLVCDVYGWPQPSIHWVRIDPETEKAQPITVNVTAADPRIMANGSVFTISPISKEDYTAYSCVAINHHGSANATSLVRVKGKYSAVWPFVGAIIEVIILIAIIVYFEKKKAKEIAKKKAMQEEEERLLKAQVIKSDVRQRK